MLSNNFLKIHKIHFVLLILLFFTITYFSSISFATSTADIPSMDVDVYLNNDGNVHIKKTIHYYDYATDIPIEVEQNPENLKVTFEGAFADFDIHDFQPGKRLWNVELYSNPQKTIPFDKKNVDVIMEYDLPHALGIYNDAAIFEYKLVDNKWYESVGKINANIHLESINNVKYELNGNNNFNSSWNSNDLQISAQDIPEGTPLGLKLVVPRDQFDKDPKYGSIINDNILDDMARDEAILQFEENFINVSPILGYLMLLASVIPLFIYLIYGREPKIDYNAKYETDLPTDDPPAIVNAVCTGVLVGVPDLDGFRATILDLIDRNYILLNDAPYGEDYDTSGSLFLEINPDYDSDTLWEFEVQVLNFLQEYEQDGIISMDMISESLGYLDSSESFKSTYKNWRNEVKKTLLAGDSFKESFYNKGDKYLKIFAFFGLIPAIALFIIVVLSKSAFHNLFSGMFTLSALILGLVSLISLLLPQRIAGHWTPYGREYYEKWESFKRYVQDYSLIKDSPPESVKIWNKYLVYATALGAAKGVKKAMELSIPQKQLKENDVYIYHSESETFGSSMEDT
ncbi:MAG TPA: DUF2207 domain-containing protein, partial [Methanobacterium sp.]|nr:DUF2207 domain-containing protein [Methanobacterium sp.]